VDFLSKEAVALLNKKFPGLTPDVQNKVGDAVHSAANLVADVAAIVAAIRTSSVISNPPKS
jgi:Na+-transporting NADH:ubiquinone oxidoreductase subunit NqrA